MRARDVMTTHVITAEPDATIQEVAQLLLKHRFSAVPVVDQNGELVGIVSEGDLMRRAEVGTERRRGWWLRLLTGAETLAADYVKSHARKASDVMTKHVITATPDMPLSNVATLLERNSIKRVPIVENGKLVGMVTRANLVQAFATMLKESAPEVAPNDTAIREKLLDQLRKEPWAQSWQLNVTVKDGVVDLWGVVNSDAERKAVRVAAENIASVRAVRDHLVQQPTQSWAY